MMDLDMIEAITARLVASDYFWHNYKKITFLQVLMQKEK